MPIFGKIDEGFRHVSGTEAVRVDQILALPLTILAELMKWCVLQMRRTARMDEAARRLFGDI